jgi:hypothetical protein
LNLVYLIYQTGIVVVVWWSLSEWLNHHCNSAATEPHCTSSYPESISGSLLASTKATGPNEKNVA